MARSKYRILAHLRGGDTTETSLVSIEKEGGGLGVMKRLKLGADAEPAAMERFTNEAHIAKSLDHPNLAKLIEAGMDDGGPVLVFEYVEGVSLSRLRSRAVKSETKGVPKAIALRIVAGIAQGLAHAHGLTDADGKSLQVVLRDVSPDNVLITYDGEVKIVDFGMATTVHTAAKSREDRVKGNIAYMAPEQVRRDYKLDARADIFALGIILWELLTGTRFWEGMAEVDVLKKLGDDTPFQGPRMVVSDIPEPLDKLCSEAIKKVRDERIESVSQFIERFKDVAKTTGLKATAEEVGEFVTNLFEDEREKMRTIVEEARLASDTGEHKRPLPAVGAPATDSSSNPLADKESDPRLRFGIATPEEEPSKRVVEVVAIPTPLPSDRRFAYLMAGLAVIVLGVAAIVASKMPKEAPKLDEKPYEPPVRPTSTAAASVSAYQEPEEVTIDVRVTPPEAELIIDGVKVTNPHRRRVVPSQFQHTIRAKAENYETRTQQVTFDKERSIEWALVPEKTKPGQPPPPPPPSTKKPGAPPIVIPNPVNGNP